MEALECSYRALQLALLKAFDESSKLARALSRMSDVSYDTDLSSTCDEIFSELIELSPESSLTQQDFYDAFCLYHTAHQSELEEKGFMSGKNSSGYKMLLSRLRIMALKIANSSGKIRYDGLKLR